MARILLVHTTYETIGGGEVLGIKLREALENIGYEIIHLTINPEKFKILTKNINKNMEIHEILERPLSEKLLAIITRKRVVKLRRLLLAITVAKNSEIWKKKYNADLIIDTSSGYPIPIDIVYLHQPTIIALLRSNNPLNKLYLSLILHIGDGYLGQPRLALTNSKYTADLLKKSYSFLRDVKILHPPIDYEYFSQKPATCRRKWAVTLSRIVKKKRIDSLLDLASQLEDWTFHLIGFTNTPSSRKYYKKLFNIIEIRKLTNVIIHPNATREEIREIFTQSCAYIHPPFHEFFGIAVAEAMSAGIPPIVYKEGGSWTDLVSPCCPELGYNDIDEIPEKLEEIYNNFNKYSEKAKLMASNFSMKSFEYKLSKYIESLLKLYKNP